MYDTSLGESLSGHPMGDYAAISQIFETMNSTGWFQFQIRWIVDVSNNKNGTNDKWMR